MTTQDALRIHMTGAEWFGTRAGGLNRYFESLYSALAQRPDVHVTAQAFGDPPADAGHGAASWGTASGSTLGRVRASRVRIDLPAGAILDRHFSLYGGPVRGALPVAHFHGPWAAESAVAGDKRVQQWIKYIFEKTRYSRIERFIVLSGAFRDLLTSSYGIGEDRIRIVPPGVDLRRFTSSPMDEGGAHVVLCVRRLEKRMGIDNLLKAWRELGTGTRDAKLVIVGVGTHEDTLRREAAALGIGDQVVFAGRVSDEQLADYYARSLFTVVPSVALEGFGLISLESLASGRAPIVTNCGGLPDAVKELDASLIVPANDIGALAARMNDAFDGKIPSRGDCRAHAETFSWEAVARKHVDIYRGLSR